MRRVLAALLFASVAGGASAAPIPIERSTTTFIDPDLGGDLAGAFYYYENRIGFDQGAGDYTVILNQVPLSQGTTVSGFGTSTTNVASIPAGTLSLPVTVSSPGGPGQGFGFSNFGSAGTVPGQSFITTGILGGRFALTFSGGGSNFVSSGGRFVSTVFIIGDFTDPGSHTAPTFGAGYTLTTDFAYDSVNDLTQVRVATDDYVETGPGANEGMNPNLSFVLLGGEVPVPEPASLGLLGMGLAGLVLRRRA